VARIATVVVGGAGPAGLLMAAGGPVFAWLASGLAARLTALTAWFLLALPFVAGLYLFELLDRRFWEHARLGAPHEE
jgi:hypothetical protein